MMPHLKKMQRFLPPGLVAVALVLANIAWAETSGHEGIACSNCHQSGAMAASAEAGSPSGECVGCHSAAEVSRGRFHGTAQNRCLECHSFHEPELVTTIAGSVALKTAGNMDGGHCQSCHDSRGNLGSLSPSHKVAAELYHREAGQLENTSPSDACLKCHSNSSDSSWQAATNGEVLAFNTHASHPYSVKVIPGKGNSSNWIAHEIDARLPLFEGKIECQTCHLLTADNDDLMVPFETKYDLCLGCHKHYGDDQEEAGKMMATFVKR